MSFPDAQPALGTRRPVRQEPVQVGAQFRRKPLGGWTVETVQSPSSVRWVGDVVVRHEWVIAGTGRYGHRSPGVTAISRWRDQVQYPGVRRVTGRDDQSDGYAVTPR